MKKEFIRFHYPWTGREEETEIVKAMRAGWIASGPKVRKFEAQFARYSGARHAVAVNSCTAALHLALVSLGIGKGDEVITTPFTFAATANVIVHCGARPVFVDVEEDTGNIDPGRIGEAVTKRTRAIIPVHFAGHPCEMDRISAIARRHDLKVVEDAAHALEGRYRDRKIGSISQCTAFSFYATKNITTAEGGMLTTNDDRIAGKAEVLRLHGMSRDAWKRYSRKGPVHYEVLYPGFKCNMNDIQAAMGIWQLKKVRRFQAIRKRHWKAYSSGLGGIDGLVLPVERPHVVHARHLYVVRIMKNACGMSRDEFVEKLRAKGIGTAVHFTALHLHPYYRKALGCRRGMFPAAERLSDTVVSLPLYPRMTSRQVESVITAVRCILR